MLISDLLPEDMVTFSCHALLYYCAYRLPRDMLNLAASCADADRRSATEVANVEFLLLLWYYVLLY